VFIPILTYYRLIIIYTHAYLGTMYLKYRNSFLLYPGKTHYHSRTLQYSAVTQLKYSVEYTRLFSVKNKIRKKLACNMLVNDDGNGLKTSSHTHYINIYIIHYALFLMCVCKKFFDDCFRLFYAFVSSQTCQNIT